MTSHLDRIQRLDFSVQLNWGRAFEIIYELDDSQGPLTEPYNYLKVLSADYIELNSLNYEEFCESACDYFYSWYNKNLKLIQDYEVDKTNPEAQDRLFDSCLGDISKQIYRDHGIEGLLN